MPPWMVSGSPTFRRTWRLPILRAVASSGCSTNGAPHGRGITSTIPAAARPRRHLRWSSTRCATRREADDLSKHRKRQVTNVTSAELLDQAPAGGDAHPLRRHDGEVVALGQLHGF